jgi:putative superfamily III holin-X
MTPEHAPEPSLTSALGHAVDASQRLLADRIDLARLDVIDVVTRAERGGMLAAIGALVLVVGWTSLTAALVFALQDQLTLPASMALAGVINTLFGVALVGAGAHRAAASGLLASGRGDTARNA